MPDPGAMYSSSGHMNSSGNANQPMVWVSYSHSTQSSHTANYYLSVDVADASSSNECLPIRSSR